MKGLRILHINPSHISDAHLFSHANNLLCLTISLKSQPDLQKQRGTGGAMRWLSGLR